MEKCVHTAEYGKQFFVGNVVHGKNFIFLARETVT
jgi:hypothetical protein